MEKESAKVQARYNTWEKTIKAFIKKAQDERSLGSLEVAKSLYAYGNKLYTDLMSSALSESDRLAFVNEMRRRTELVLNHCIKHGARAEFVGDETVYVPKEWIEEFK